MFGLLALLLLAYGLEVIRMPQAALLGLSAEGGLALGAFQPASVLAGEWWRLLTALILHGSLLHLLQNAFVLFLLGIFIEAKVGTRIFLLTFTLAGLGGWLADLSCRDAAFVTLGASGGILGLLMLGFMAAFLEPDADRRWKDQKPLLLCLLFSMVPRGPGGASVDLVAHLGGAATGVLMGAALLIRSRWTGWKPRRLPMGGG